MPFILVLIKMYVVGEFIKLFPLSLCLLWGGYICYPFFSELQWISSLLLLRAILISYVGMGAVTSFTAFWTRQILHMKQIWVMKETVTVCIKMSELVYNIFEGLAFQNKHCIYNASFSSRTNECVFKVSCRNTFWVFKYHLKRLCCFKKKKS